MGAQIYADDGLSGIYHTRGTFFVWDLVWSVCPRPTPLTPEETEAQMGSIAITPDEMQKTWEHVRTMPAISLSASFSQRRLTVSDALKCLSFVERCAVRGVGANGSY